MSSISDLAEVLAENLPVALEDRNMTSGDLDRLARLPAGLTDRLIANDPAAYPCPRQFGRISIALDMTVAEILAD